MQFASPLPWWLVALVAAGIGGAALLSYRRPLVPLSAGQRTTLTLLRALSLALVVAFACRPVVFTAPEGDGDVVVPVLIDVSRSMRIADVDGASRLSRATALVRERLMPALAGQARVDVFAIGDGAEPASIDALRPEGSRSDLAGAIAAVSDRVSGRAVSGIVLISDGADTTTPSAEGSPGDVRLPVFAVGVGSSEGPPDREVLGVTAGDRSLDESSIELRVSLASRGLDRSPFQLRVTANGQLIESRPITPTENVPIDQVFTVAPDPARATVYTAQIVADAPDAIPENDVQSTLVSPAGRKRRILLIAGAPGYEQTFLARALAADSSLDLDSVIRKGRNDQNADTFLVQAGGQRAPLLTAGFPSTRDGLFIYDAVVLANVDGEALSRAQLALAADFVAVRGGGLIVLGGRSFEQRGLMGTALEDVLPVELSDRRGGGTRLSTEEGPAPRHAIGVTADGRTHPVMRIGATADQSKTLWETLPALAASAAVGGPRAGASVLAVTTSSSGGVLPVIAVQRYGRGRSMIFAGEGAWRWRMLLPAADRRYELFWRQAMRWLSSAAPDPVSVAFSDYVDPGTPLVIDIDARDAAFTPVSDAIVTARLTGPDGQPQNLTVRPSGGRFVANAMPAVAGLHRLQIDVRRSTASLGSIDRWLYVGGRDRELADPRLNDGVLRRLARESGGEYVAEADFARVISDLRTRVPQRLDRTRRDLWHEPWAFALVIAVLACEWLLRKRWGLR